MRTVNCGTSREWLKFSSFSVLRSAFGTGQPEKIALHDDLPISQGGSVVADQPFKRQGKEAVHPAIDELIPHPGLLH